MSDTTESTRATGVVLSENAAAKILELIEKQDFAADQAYLYVGVKGGGCSGLQYLLDLRDETKAPVNDADVSFESNGIRIVCDLKSYMIGNLDGTTIDFKDGLMGAGFSFDNPNAVRNCGCGSSFSA